MGGGGGGGGPVIPYPFNLEHSYPLSLNVSTALSPKVSRVEFSPYRKVKSYIIVSLDAIKLISYLCLPLRITIMIAHLNGNAAVCCGIDVTAYLIASFFLGV